MPKTLCTVSQWGFLKTKNSTCQKQLFGKNWNLACRVVLSIYTFYIIFKQIWAWHHSWPTSHLKANILRFVHVGNFLSILLSYVEKKLVNKGSIFFVWLTWYDITWKSSIDVVIIDQALLFPTQNTSIPQSKKVDIYHRSVARRHPSH